MHSPFLLLLPAAFLTALARTGAAANAPQAEPEMPTLSPREPMRAEPAKRKSAETSILDETGHLVRPIAPAEVKAWKREFRRRGGLHMSLCFGLLGDLTICSF